MKKRPCCPSKPAQSTAEDAQTRDLRHHQHRPRSVSGNDDHFQFAAAIAAVELVNAIVRCASSGATGDRRVFSSAMASVAVAFAHHAPCLRRTVAAHQGTAPSLPADFCQSARTMRLQSGTASAWPFGSTCATAAIFRPRSDGQSPPCGTDLLFDSSVQLLMGGLTGAQGGGGSRRADSTSLRQPLIIMVGLFAGMKKRPFSRLCRSSFVPC